MERRYIISERDPTGKETKYNVTENQTSPKNTNYIATEKEMKEFLETETARLNAEKQKKIPTAQQFHKLVEHYFDY